LATIVRCPSCISLVYDGADSCHHCGEELTRKKRRLLGKGAIGFILLAVVVFSIGDAVYLAKERSKRLRFDRALMQDFVDAVEGRGPLAPEHLFMGKRDRDHELAHLRQALITEFGESHKIHLQEPRWLGSDEEIVVWNNLHDGRDRTGRSWPDVSPTKKEVEVRRYEVPVKFRKADSKGPWNIEHLRVAIAGSVQRSWIVDVSWDQQPKPEATPDAARLIRHGGR